jgi:hypothetical protein
MSETTTNPAQASAASPSDAPIKPVNLEAWFARAFPVGHPRSAMGPVHWKGWLAILAYVGATLAGALAFLVMAVAGLFVTGVILFAVTAFGALLALLIIVSLKGDDGKTIEDYANETRAKAKLNA